jgi:hypothetical protein
MDAARAIEIASGHLASLSGHIFDLLALSKPISPGAALNLAKIISKLSPLLGSLIEFNAVELLNEKDELKDYGRWRRQDPDFPDAVFDGKIVPIPGMEVKAWFPLVTEITARFKSSQNHFIDGRTKTHVCMLAWLPEQLIYGRPYILDVMVSDGLSVAKARDDHYHNPPGYIVLEPEDTKERTRNLQQTNTSGYKLQEESEKEEAEIVVETWGTDGKKYKPTRDYQQQLRELRSKFNYRLDTNFAKMDRISHPDIEQFKTRVCGTTVNGLTVGRWTKMFKSVKNRGGKQPKNLAAKEALLRAALAKHLEIKEEPAGKLLV